MFVYLQNIIYELIDPNFVLFIDPNRKCLTVTASITVGIITALSRFYYFFLYSTDLQVKLSESSSRLKSSSSLMQSRQTYFWPNGLTVDLSQITKRPAFYAEIVTRAGSKHDSNDTYGTGTVPGASTFKGTRSIGTIDYAQEEPPLDEIAELYAKALSRRKRKPKGKRFTIRSTIISIKASTFADAQ